MRTAVGAAPHLNGHEHGNHDSVVVRQAADGARADNALDDCRRLIFEGAETFLQGQRPAADFQSVKALLGCDIANVGPKRSAGRLVVGPDLRLIRIDAEVLEEESGDVVVDGHGSEKKLASHEILPHNVTSASTRAAPASGPTCGLRASGRSCSSG